MRVLRPCCSRTAGVMSGLMSTSKGASRQELLENLFKRQPRIVLGSESTSRRVIMDELSREYGFSYETARADIDEASLGSRIGRPEDLVILLARAKAEAIRSRGRGSGLLITCDQVVVHDGRILEKPRSADEAREFIQGHSGSMSQTVGAVVCTNLDSGRECSGLDVAEVHFKDIPADVIDTLIDEGEVMRCAGGLMIEHPLVTPLISRISGTEDAIKGLPKQLTLRLLLEAADS